MLDFQPDDFLLMALQMGSITYMGVSGLLGEQQLSGGVQ